MLFWPTFIQANDFRHFVVQENLTEFHTRIPSLTRMTVMKTRSASGGNGWSVNLTNGRLIYPILEL
jgi:hypothetical protein